MNCMLHPARSTFILVCCISVLGAAVSSFAAEASTTEKVAPAVSQLKASFAPEAALSPADLEQVATLTRQCGLRDVAELQTFYELPSRVRSIYVASSKQTVGRNISFECVYMERIGWHEGGAPPRSKKVGPFWVTKPYKSPVLLRGYQIADRQVQVQICDGIRTALADAVLTQLINHKVQFKDEDCRSQFNKLDLSESQCICRGEGGAYRLDLRSNTIVWFKVQKGVVVVTKVGFFGGHSG